MLASGQNTKKNSGSQHHQMVTVFEKTRDNEERFEGLRRNKSVTVACPSLLNMCRVVYTFALHTTLKNFLAF